MTQPTTARCLPALPVARALLLSAAVLAVLQCAALPARAQPAAQTTPRDLRPVLPPGPSLRLPEAAPEVAPPGADQLFAAVRAVEVQGGLPELHDASMALADQVAGRSTPLTTFYQLADAIEGLYRRAGYPLARVVLPPQTIADGGVLRLRVVQGFIERVDVSALPAAARAMVSRALARLPDQRPLRAEPLERALTLAGRAAGTRLRSTLAAGQAIGAVVLVIDGDFDAFGGSVATDNRLSDNLGPWGLTVQLRANQWLGQGEQLYLQASTSPRSGELLRGSAPRRVVGGGLVWPLGNDGLSLNAEWTRSVSMPRADAVPLVTRSDFDRGSLRLSYPWWLLRDRFVQLNLALEAIDQRNGAPAFAVQFDHDRLRVLRVGIEGQTPGPGGAPLQFSATVSAGLKGLGSRTQADADATGIALSRPGMRVDFTKLEAGASIDQPLPQGMALRLAVRGQAGLRGVLPSAELFSLDGDDALSAFSSGALSGDSGWWFRPELSRPFTWPAAGGLLLQPYLYGAAGRVHNQQGASVAPGWNTAVGAGLRLQVAGTSWQLEHGHAWSGVARLNGTHINLKAQVSF